MLVSNTLVAGTFEVRSAELQNRLAVPGNRLLTRSAAISRHRPNFREVVWASSKAAPLHGFRPERPRKRGSAPHSLLASYAIDLAERMIIEEIRLDPAEFGSIVNLDSHVEIKRTNGGALIEQYVFRPGQDV